MPLISTSFSDSSLPPTTHGAGSAVARAGRVDGHIDRTEPDELDLDVERVHATQGRGTVDGDLVWHTVRIVDVQTRHRGVRTNTAWGTKGEREEGGGRRRKEDEWWFDRENIKLENKEYNRALAS